jgi:hypothetical protein
MVPFRPPRGVNIPQGYQPTLNRHAAEISREFATKLPDGGYRYPVHVRGLAERLTEFKQQMESLGSCNEIGMDVGEGESDLWFEYTGEIPSTEIREVARLQELNVVQCGATLLLVPSESDFPPESSGSRFP